MLRIARGVTNGPGARAVTSHCYMISLSDSSGEGGGAGGGHFVMWLPPRFLLLWAYPHGNLIVKWPQSAPPPSPENLPRKSWRRKHWQRKIIVPPLAQGRGQVLLRLCPSYACGHSLYGNSTKQIRNSADRMSLAGCSLVSLECVF